MWRIIKQACNSNELSSSTNTDSVEVDGIVTSWNCYPGEIAEAFSKFFINVGSNNHNNLIYSNSIQHPPTFTCFSPVNINKVNAYVDTMKASVATPDGFTTKTIKLFVKYFPAHVVNLINY